MSLRLRLIIIEKPIITQLISTVKNISSCSLYYMLCFQMLNISEVYFEFPESPKEVMFDISLSFMLFILSICMPLID